MSRISFLIASIFFGNVFATCLKASLEGKPLQLVATSDTGYIGAEAFLNPEQYKRKGISQAGDEVTFEQMERIFSHKTGKDVPTTFRPICFLFMVAMKDMVYMFKWFYNEGYGADIQRPRDINPSMKNFETWLETESAFFKGMVCTGTRQRRHMCD